MSDLLELAEAVASRARPGEEVEAYVARGHETEIRVFEGEIESLSSATTSGIGIRVLVGGDGAGSRLGFAWAGSLDPDVVSATLEEARDNAAFATPDPEVDFARFDGVAPVALDLWDPELTDTPTDRKVSMALELERRVRAGDRRIRQVASADYGDDRVEVALASSVGLRAEMCRTSAVVSVSAIAGEGPDSQTGTGFSAARGPGGLDLDAAVNDALTRSTRLLGAVKPRSGRVTVVFDPRVTSSLLAIVASALSGEAVVKGRSFFAERLGEVVATPEVTLVDDPTDRRALSAATHDAEGLACRRNVLIEGGRLRGFVYDTVSANRAGTTSTGSAVRGGYAGTPGAGCRAVVLNPGELDGDGVLAAVGEGLYVQSVSGLHSGVSPVSGDFSVGAEGLMIRGGALAEPVREMTIASTLQRMLQSVVCVGGDLEWLPGIAAGQTLAVGDMQLSGR